MNRLLKNTANQVVDFDANNGATPLTGLTYSPLVSKDNGAFAAGSGTMEEVSHGAYQYHPSAADTNGDLVVFIFWETGTAGPTVTIGFHTEVPLVLPDVVLAAAQPHYAPSKPGDAMALVANQDVRNILGSVAGNLLGNVIGTVPSPAALSDGAVDAILNRVNGILPGLSLKIAMQQLVAALVNVQAGFQLAGHVGPTSPSIVPRFPANVRTQLGVAAVQLQKVLALNQAQPELALLSPALATAVQQLSTAIDAVRTQSA